jgi:hypothetical protein
LATDDASLTTAGACQIESWFQYSERTTEYWAVPACNPGGNFEWTAGIARFEPEDAAGTTELQVQAKTLVQPVAPGKPGIGLAFGAQGVIDSAHDDEALTQLYAYIPASVAFAGDRSLIHANLGWHRDRVLNINSTTWGLAGVFAATTNSSVFGELYGDDRVHPFVQTGLTRAFAEGLVHLDLTVGRQLGGTTDSTFASLGLNLYFPPYR